MKKFIQLDKYGQLYIDKVFFESYFPVIFTCINDRKDVFISVCCQNNEKGCKWLLGKTNGRSIVRMLRDEITIRRILLECSSERISVDYAGNGYIVACDNSDWDVDSPYLPKEDSYMYAEDGEFEEEINYFSLMDSHVHYNAEYYQCVAETVESINKEIETIADALAVFASTIGSISIPSEVVNTLKVFGKVCTNLEVNKESYMNQEKYESVYENFFNMQSECLGIVVDSNDSNYADAA